MFLYDRLTYFAQGIFIQPLILGPTQIGNDFSRPKMRRRIAMAIEAPPHAERFNLIDLLHGVDATMARHASDSASHVGAVVKVNVVGQIMDPDPTQWNAALGTFPQRCKVFAIALDRRVAIHAHRSCGNGGEGGRFDRRVAIATIQSHLPGMDGMRECDRLPRRVPHVSRAGRATEVEEEDQIGRPTGRQQASQRFGPVGPSWERESASVQNANHPCKRLIVRQRNTQPVLMQSSLWQPFATARVRPP